MRWVVALLVFVAACGDNAKLDPCAPGCPDPVSPRCEGQVLVVTDPGVCGADGTCGYGEERTDCAAMQMTCSAGACHASNDPCANATCETPPPAFCTDAVATTYDAAGTCDGSTGSAVCSYASHTTDCAASQKICQSGACVDACTGVTCDMPPNDMCTGNVLTHYDTSGTCDGSSGTATCSYGSTQTDCAAANEQCQSASCIDPCMTNPCTTPPSDTCSDGLTLQHYGATGTCTSPGGVVACDYTPTAVDCGAMDQACTGGACVDPCIGVTCDTPPPPTCTNNVAHTFAATGTCASPGGIPTCSYAATDQDCTLTGQTCAAGACTGTQQFCRVQFPDSITDVATTTQTIYGRIFVQGITDQSGVDDPDPTVVVELGVGTGTDPTAYTYSAATPNLSYGPGSPGYEANNDEYQAALVVPNAPGTTLSYAYRLSIDTGATWMYCDTGTAGSSDGFTTPGTLNVAAPHFSEYVEGTSNNKAVEIYNPGSIPFDLSTCSVQVFFNGATTVGATIPLTGTIPAGGVFTACKSLITDTSHCDLLSTATVWNGDDAVRLLCGTTTYDVIGQIGVDPGTAWGTGTTTTLDHTLLRVCSVFAGDTDGTDAFDPATQWAGYPVDTFMYLGARNCPLP